MWNRRTSSEHISLLVAEDNPHDQLLFAMAAEDCGPTTTVTFAKDGIVLLDTLHELSDAQQPPTAIVLDLQMPRLGGYDTLASIQSTPHLADVPVVVFSNSSQPSEVRRSLDGGAVQHIVKPSTYEELLTFVESLGQLCSNDRSNDRETQRAA